MGKIDRERDNERERERRKERVKGREYKEEGWRKIDIEKESLSKKTEIVTQIITRK